MVSKIPRFRVRVRGNVTYYFYDHGGKPRRETSLGKDYGLAIKRWAELEHADSLPPAAIVLFKHVAEAYRREVIPTKAPRTQRDNMTELAKLHLQRAAGDGAVKRVQIGLGVGHVRASRCWERCACCTSWRCECGSFRGNSRSVVARKKPHICGAFDCEPGGRL